LGLNLKFNLSVDNILGGVLDALPTLKVRLYMFSMLGILDIETPINELYFITLFKHIAIYPTYGLLDKQFL